MILGIETSCDDSAVAILDMHGNIVANEISSQINFHDKYGGVVPEIASRQHLISLPILIRYVFEKYHINPNHLKAIAVTHAPGLIGSLLVGVSYAKSLAWVYNIPLIPVDHLEGHLLAPFLDNPELKFPYLGLIASGGHTHLVHARNLYDYILLGKTIDDAVGEAFDKVAKMLGFQYPGGPVIDQIASSQPIADINFPIPLKGKKTLNFSFSGLKTAVRNEAITRKAYIEKMQLININAFEAFADSEQKKTVQNICASFQKVVSQIILERFKKALKFIKVDQIAVTGGVAANTGIRTTLTDYARKRKIQAFFPSSKNCTDNAAMIAYTGLQHFKNGIKFDSDYFALNASPKSRLSTLIVHDVFK
ncbi:MAG: tRNA (adenosine(37)-N6)-threonylcarbamoyltransferase complex transferase subunit TsaD [Deltaproteobacteria bacterium]|jgi:N6-L-threonylcarbamoyladenine synthase|nr:tRNA (adenosine(37)-N6)-threonylcarbamoyltransferase complex transferase subunit TsaD [Deltaproteobacteria bacterium]MBT4526202.1 tRNA (adenosine(37)-N6)-threonylcarbamoyltransferase complex transferase subunit TsaD [Deltaproteobacteria bacterium]